jgi:glucose/arabinose dehydrogenase
MAFCMPNSQSLRFAALVAALLAAASAAGADELKIVPEIVEENSAAQDFTIRRIAGPFNHPWSIAFLPDGRLLVSERWGELKLVQPGDGEQKSVSFPFPRPREDHAGLMEVALDPDFIVNRTIFVSYVHGERKAATVRLVKAKLNLETHELEEAKIIYESGSPAGGLEEFGGRIVFDKDGYLFMSLGDRYDRKRAQDRSDAHGSIIRLNRDGSIPKDNPFVGEPGIRPEIWSYGHRNPQGLEIDSATGTLWSTEHGPMGGDELNIIERGKNYGWPTITYGTEYDGTPINHGRTHADGMEQPVHYWVPSIAISSLAIYDGPFKEWQGTAWVGGLAGQVLVRLKLNDRKVTGEQRFFKDKLGRIRDVRAGPDGFIYFSTDDPQGEIYRLEPKKRHSS